MAKGTRSRPTKVMMLAVNAAIDGDRATVDKVMDENSLDWAELEQRVHARNGRKYTSPSNAGKRRSSPARPPTMRNHTPDLNLSIDGRTSVRQLFRLIELADEVKMKAQQELKRRPLEQIEPVKQALSEIELLRREREKLESRIRLAEDALA